MVDMKNKLNILKHHVSKDKKNFYPTGAISEIIGCMCGNIESMRNKDLDRLDKNYYADKFDELADNLQELRDFMVDHGMYNVQIKADK
tara:strand:+ start:134 stop:397 length:264 start_codon:yes stop_codon:yes gene_type:complete